MDCWSWAAHSLPHAVIRGPTCTRSAPASAAFNVTIRVAQVRGVGSPPWRAPPPPESSGSYRASGGGLQGCPSGGRSRRVPLSSTPAAGRLTPPAGRAPADLARRGPTERRTVLRRLKARMAQRGAPRPHLPDRERRRRVRTRQTRADRPLRRERRRPLWNSPALVVTGAMASRALCVALEHGLFAGGGEILR